MPVKPKGVEVYVLDWQGDESTLKDYVADQYVWVADCTKTNTPSGVQLVKEYFKINDDPGIEHSKKNYHTQKNLEKLSHILNVILSYS